MEHKCDAEGCHEKATRHVTEITDGKVVTARVCDQHVTDVSGAVKEPRQSHGRALRRLVKRDPIVVAKLADLLMPPLCQGILDANADVRLHCVSMFWQFGASAITALPMLRNLMNDPDEEVREMARWTLERIEEASEQKPGHELGTQF